MEISEKHFIDNYEFENLIADIFNAEQNLYTYLLFGRKGQAQDGIDIYSSDTGVAIQCKYRVNNKINVSVIQREIIEEANKVRLAPVSVKHLVYATTLPHDKNLQVFAENISPNYPFSISYLGWDEILKKVVNNKAIFNRYFSLNSNRIELARLRIDSDNCSWEEKSDFIFFKKGNNKSPFPIFDFSFINNTVDTILLNKMFLHVCELPLGISGVPESGKLGVIAKYKLGVDSEKLTNELSLDIYAKSKAPFRFQVELFKYSFDYKQCKLFDGRYILYFKFLFNNNQVVKAPKVFLNCWDGSPSSQIRIIY